MKKMKKILALLLTIVMTTSLVACGGDKGESKEPAPEVDVTDKVESNLELDENATYKKEVVIAYEQKHSTMDPQQVANGIHDTLYNMVFNQLVVFNGETKEIEPELAESWEMLEDGKVWSFKLREDITFSNGEPLTADDVLFTYERAVATGVSTSATTAVVESVAIDGDYIVNYTLKSPNMDFLYAVAQGCNSILNRDACEADPDKGHEIGTGGWKVEDWTASEYADFVRWDDSWVWADGLTPTEKVSFKIMSEASARGVAVQTGEVDLAFRPNLNEMAEFAQDENVDYFVMSSESIDYLSLNFNNEMLKDENLRKAIAYAIDVQGIIDIACEGYGTPCTSLWGPNQYGFYDEFEEPWGYNLEKAKEYMAKSNYPNGCDLEITSVASYAMFVEVLQAQLSAIGINVKVNITDSPGLADMVTNNKIEALVYNKTCGPEGDNMRNVLVDGQGANRVRYANPRNEELLNLALGETDEAARLGYYQEIQEIVREDCYYIPLGYPVTHALYNSKLSGVIWNANQKHDYTHVVCAE